MRQKNPKQKIFALRLRDFAHDVGPPSFALYGRGIWILSPLWRRSPNNSLEDELAIICGQLRTWAFERYDFKHLWNYPWPATGSFNYVAIAFEWDLRAPTLCGYQSNHRANSIRCYYLTCCGCSAHLLGVCLSVLWCTYQPYQPQLLSPHCIVALHWFLVAINNLLMCTMSNKTFVDQMHSNGLVSRWCGRFARIGSRAGHQVAYEFGINLLKIKPKLLWNCSVSIYAVANVSELNEVCLIKSNLNFVALVGRRKSHYRNKSVAKHPLQFHHVDLCCSTQHRDFDLGRRRRKNRTDDEWSCFWNIDWHSNKSFKGCVLCELVRAIAISPRTVSCSESIRIMCESISVRIILEHCWFPYRVFCFTPFVQHFVFSGFLLPFFRDLLLFFERITLAPQSAVLRCRCFIVDVKQIIKI